MSGQARNRLYQLLPAIYRLRDAEGGLPLQALLAVMEQEFAAIEDDIAQLYDNWFIETCDEWVVPYIGDLLRVRGLGQAASSALSQRTFVANTLAYRRRKGTAAVLEQVARDITGNPPRAVEYFERLSTTQHVNHVRLHAVRTPDLRDGNALELLETPFGAAMHTADVRSIAAGRGRYNILNLGLHLWRLQNYDVERADARPLTNPSNGLFTIDLLGRAFDANNNDLAMPLCNPPQTEAEISHLAEEFNVPGELRRRPLYQELEARRQALVDGRTPSAVYFGAQPAFQIFLDDQKEPVSPERIAICNLSGPEGSPKDWRRPPSSRKYKKNGAGPEQSMAIDVGVDPKLGRLALPAGSPFKSVEVNYSYAFSADLGGGPYDRRESLLTAVPEAVQWQAGVSRIFPQDKHPQYRSLRSAVEAWKPQQPGTVGIIAILDSHSYTESLTGVNHIRVPAGSVLVVVAADWPAQERADMPGVFERIPGRQYLEPANLRPHLKGNLEVEGLAGDSQSVPGIFVLNGILLEGSLKALGGDLGTLRIQHCTLDPAQGGLQVDAPNQSLRVIVERSITGPITLAAGAPAAAGAASLALSDSIVLPAAGAQNAIAASAAGVDVVCSTLLGGVTAKKLSASESIFTGTVQVTQNQEGCVRFSYVPLGSATPRQFRCQPALALAGITDLQEQKRIAARLTPLFTSLRHGAAAFAQLADLCAQEIRTGAEDGAEMGAFHHLKQALRESMLRLTLDEYLRLGLQAGIFHVT